MDNLFIIYSTIKILRVIGPYVWSWSALWDLISQTYVEIASLCQSCGIVSEENEVDKGVVLFKYLNLAPKINTRKFGL